MANETENANYLNPTDAVQAVILGAAVQNNVTLPFINSFGKPSNVTMKLPKAGSLTAAALAESTAATIGAGQEYSETSASVTIAKVVVPTKLTYEAQFFNATGRADKTYLAKLQGEAIGRYIDSAVFALASSFSGGVTTYAAAALEGDAIFSAEMTLGVNNTMGQRNIGLFTPKQVNEIRSEMLAATGTVYANPLVPNILTGFNADTKVVGQIGNTVIMQVNGLPTVTTTTVGLVFNPLRAFGAFMSDSIDVIDLKVGSAGYWDEISSVFMFGVAEWEDAAGIKVTSVTA